MLGGATVLGVLRAIAQLNLPSRPRGVPATRTCRPAKRRSPATGARHVRKPSSLTPTPRADSSSPRVTTPRSSARRRIDMATLTGAVSPRSRRDTGIMELTRVINEVHQAACEVTRSSGNCRSTRVHEADPVDIADIRTSAAPRPGRLRRGLTRIHRRPLWRTSHRGPAWATRRTAAPKDRRACRPHARQLRRARLARAAATTRRQKYRTSGPVGGLRTEASFVTPRPLCRT